MVLKHRLIFVIHVMGLFGLIVLLAYIYGGGLGDVLLV